MKKKWVVGTVVLLLILAYWGYRQQDTYHLIRSIIKNNPYCEAFQINNDGSKADYTVEVSDIGWGVRKKIEGLSFVNQGEKIEYRITLANYTEKADGIPGEESGISLSIDKRSEFEGKHEKYYYFKINKVEIFSYFVDENGELSRNFLGDSGSFPEEIEDIFRLIEKDIQKRAQKCWY